MCIGKHISAISITFFLGEKYFKVDFNAAVLFRFKFFLTVNPIILHFSLKILINPYAFTQRFCFHKKINYVFFISIIWLSEIILTFSFPSKIDI